jgi:hypothetical protein
MSKLTSEGTIIYKSGFPFNTYLLIVVPTVLLITFLILQLNIYVLVVYLPIALALFFSFFSKYSSRIEITDTLEMSVIFFFPWNKNITIDLRKFKYIDYARGFYNQFDDRRMGYFSFLRTCYDLIIFSDNKIDAIIEIKVNMRMGVFNKIIKHLKDDAKLQLISLKSIDEITW